jgi:hypothetical protein
MYDFRKWETALKKGRKVFKYEYIEIDWITRSDIYCSRNIEIVPFITKYSYN